MSDGVQLAATYYLPDGAPPAGGWPAVLLLHGLGETRTDATNAVGMSINQIAETYLVTSGLRGADLRRARARGVRRARRHRRAARDPGRPRAVHLARGSERDRRAAHRRVRLLVRRRRPLARRGRGSPVRRDRAGDDVDRPLLRARAQDLAHSASCSASGSRSQPGRAASSQPIVNDAARRPEPARVHAFADARSSRALLGNIHVPTFLMQGRRDFAFDLDQALAAYSRLNGPKRLYLADFGHAPSPLPAGELAHVLPEAREWFDRYLKGLPNGIETRPPVEIAPDPWTGKTFSYPDAAQARRRCESRSPAASRSERTARLRERGPSSRGRLETFGAPVLRVSLSSPTSWPHVVAVLSAVTRRPGDRRQRRRNAHAPRRGSRSRSRSGMLNQMTGLPRGSRLRLTVAATSTAQSPGDLLYLLSAFRAPHASRSGRRDSTLPVLSKPISG